MFKHLYDSESELDLEATMIDGTRFYKVPSGKMYPSITSVTSFYNREVFVEMAKRKLVKRKQTKLLENLHSVELSFMML